MSNDPVDIMEIAQRRVNQALAEYNRMRKHGLPWALARQMATEAITDARETLLLAHEIQEATDAAS